MAALLSFGLWSSSAISGTSLNPRLYHGDKKEQKEKNGEKNEEEEHQNNDRGAQFGLVAHQTGCCWGIALYVDLNETIREELGETIDRRRDETDSHKERFLCETPLSDRFLLCSEGHPCFESTVIGESNDKDTVS